MLKPLAFSLVFVCLWEAEVFAALAGEETSVVQGAIYVLVAVAAIFGIIAIFNDKLLTRILCRLGLSSAEERGPEPGEGAVIHHSSGEADFDGSSGRTPPPVKDSQRDLPYPPNKSAD
jgi:hypothetical protein